MRRWRRRDASFHYSVLAPSLPCLQDAPKGPEPCRRETGENGGRFWAAEEEGGEVEASVALTLSLGGGGGGGGGGDRRTEWGRRRRKVALQFFFSFSPSLFYSPLSSYPTPPPPQEEEQPKAPFLLFSPLTQNAHAVPFFSLSLSPSTAIPTLLPGEGDTEGERKRLQRDTHKKRKRGAKFSRYRPPFWRNCALWVFRKKRSLSRVA